MHKLLNRAKRSLPSNRIEPRHPAPTDRLLPPTSLDLLRYRTHHGTNLGSIFVLEKWLFPSIFEPIAKGDSELDAVTAYAASLHVYLPSFSLGSELIAGRAM